MWSDVKLAGVDRLGWKTVVSALCPTLDTKKKTKMNGYV